MSKSRVVAEVVLWLITAQLVFVFFSQGVNKFQDHGGWARAFANWHFPVWFRILIGVMEVGAALLLLWPRTASIGAALIVVLMLGGMATHVWWHHPKDTFHEAFPLVLATILAIGRRRKSLLLAPAAVEMPRRLKGA